MLSYTSLEKHRHYVPQYQPNDEYWGLGIEQELYFEFSKRKRVPASFLFQEKPERYCVDYFKNYKEGFYLKTLEFLYPKREKLIDLPLLMNGHSLDKTDIFNEPKTLYDVNPPPNPKFSGETLFGHLQRRDRYFKEEYEKSFLFDGDTVELVTLNFYKTNLQQLLEEVYASRDNFISRMKRIFAEDGIFKEYGTIDFCRQNYPLAVYLTNLKAPCIFNNMTYHFNLTLPTQLDQDGDIEEPLEFVQKHRNLIHLIQWFEPLLIGRYGSGDFLGEVPGTHLTRTSQRCALSRYIGVGTYDTAEMKSGKILQMKRMDHSRFEDPDWWYNQFYRDSEYTKLDQIGLDINFHKHRNHGIEIRFLDWFTPDLLSEIMDFLICLADTSLMEEFQSPISDPIWNTVVVETLRNRTISSEMIQMYSGLLGMTILDGEYTFPELFKVIHARLSRRTSRGKCRKRMIQQHSAWWKCL